jgi:2-polyprenyl-3-methyl-5-hydroxy-6-metoxy-1,4-benzoquinol methylase
MNTEIRVPEIWTSESLSAQWDSIAPARNHQLRSGRDLSFEHVLKPTVLKLTEPIQSGELLDAGCGSGVLTEVLAEKFDHVLGVDMSPINIKLAQDSVTKRKNTAYICSTIEGLSSATDQAFAVIVASMVFHDAADLSSCVCALARRSTSGTTLIATITHPWFWPTYWGYEKESWFEYSKELAIEAPFRISSDVSTVGVTTHFHRPLSMYVSALREHGYRLDQMLEPVPPENVQQMYPVTWSYHRFLAFKCSFEG